MKPLPIAVEVNTANRAPLRLANYANADSGAANAGKKTDKADKKVAITTLGCKVNLFESELIAQALKTDHWQTVTPREHADLYLINTCTVTAEADRQARQAVRKAVRNNPEALVVVTGCYAQMDPDACAAIPNVDLVLGNDKKLDIHSLLPKLQQGELPKVLVGDVDQHVSLPDKLLHGFENHTRAFVQIQQGCDQGCTFCIIHRARGKSRSFAPSLILRQITRLLTIGYREIVICGVDLGSYGDDFDSHDQCNLVWLLRQIIALNDDPDLPEFKVRLSSIDPVHISDELIQLFVEHEQICRQFHLSLQSGNTLILKRMKRRYGREQLIDVITRFRQAVPDLVISADVLVGFPTETDECFAQTLDVIERLNVAFPHVFSYSKREGTPAARIPDDRQIAGDVKKIRNKAISAKGAELAAVLRQSMVGTVVQCLPEKNKRKDGWQTLRADNFVTVKVAADFELENEWQDIQIERLNGDDLIGFPVQKL